MQDHQDLLDNIPAYALGTLDPIDAEMLASHIASCSECQAELRLYQQTADHIGLGVADHAPSAGLKDRLFSQITQEPAAEKEPAKWKQWFSQRPAFALVSVGLVLVLAVSNLLLWNQVRGFRNLAFKVVQLSATEVLPDAAGMIVISGDGRYGTLVASNLTQLPDDQQYQLWLIQDGERTSGGVFSVSRGGYAALRVSSQQPLDSFTAVGITIEPYGGSPGPTGDKVLGGEF
jgi:anti-sigma-K factor RskA